MPRAVNLISTDKGLFSEFYNLLSNTEGLKVLNDGLTIKIDVGSRVYIHVPELLTSDFEAENINKYFELLLLSESEQTLLFFYHVTYSDIDSLRLVLNVLSSMNGIVVDDDFGTIQKIEKYS